MDDVWRITESVESNFTFLVIDAMTGQDAVNVAESFHQTLNLDGVILTKLDGDARGGAALSVKEVVGKPIAFASTGERLADFEPFYPDRMAENLERSYGLVYSQRVLLALTDSGLARQVAYELVQRHAMRAWRERRSFFELLAADPAVTDRLAHEPVGGVDPLQGLLQVDDVDAVALPEDEAAHLGVPAAGLVAEVDAGLQQLLHRDDGVSHDALLRCLGWSSARCARRGRATETLCRRA